MPMGLAPLTPSYFRNRRPNKGVGDVGTGPNSRTEQNRPYATKDRDVAMVVDCAGPLASPSMPPGLAPLHA
jgi:hypothetical protein